MKNQKLLSLVMMFVLLLTTSLNFVTARADGPDNPDAPLAIEAAEVNSRIGYQGVLKENNVPVSGTRDMIFRLYNSSGCVTQVGSDIVKNDVTLNNGLFTVTLDVNHADFTGDGLWVNVVVGGMSIGCTELLPAPYALSLKPGAVIEGASPHALDPVLGVIADSGTGAAAIMGMATGTGSTAGYFWQNSATGNAIYAYGKIASSTKTYLWMSGNGLAKWEHDDTTLIDHNGVGGSTIYGGSSWGSTKYVVMPVTIPGTLYGQNVQLTGLDIYWMCSASDLMGIDNIRLRRRIDANSYADIIFDDTDYVCYSGDNPDGCTIHLNLTTNNILSADSGILHLVIGLNFASEGAWNRIDGIRLTLEYHD